MPAVVFDEDANTVPEEFWGTESASLYYVTIKVIGSVMGGNILALKEEGESAKLMVEKCILMTMTSLSMRYNGIRWDTRE